MKNKLKHEVWLFVILSTVGVFSLFVMGTINYFFDERMLGIFELGIGCAGLVNVLLYFVFKNIDIASHIVLIFMQVLLAIVLVDGGIRDTGWLWTFVFPPLAFALRRVKIASWYVSLLGFFMAGVAVLEYLGHDVSIYPLSGLVQLCAAYAVVSLMVSVAERAHEKIERDYETQSAELAHDKNILWQQRDQLRIFKTAVEQSGEMMILTNSEGIVLWANKATERVTGFSIQEAIGRKAGVLWGKLMDDNYYEKMWDKIKNKKELFVSEIQNHRKNGEHFFSTINIYPLLDGQGTIQYYVATQRDITEEKEVDQMKTDFVSLVSHQLRTPLTAMRWNLETIIAGDIGVLSPKQREVLEQVLLSNDRMTKLISTLLNISRIESGRLAVETQRVEMRRYIQEMEKNCQSIGSDQKLILDLPSEDVWVTVDTSILRHIVSNFVSNASKYSPEKSVITVKLTTEKENYKISVIDEGYGIPASEQRKLFGKFFRASNVRKYDVDGTGMGLYIASMLAKMLGGKIDFTSTEGKGSIFNVILPIDGVSAKAGEVRLI